jgi:hypothetical protein
MDRLNGLANSTRWWPDAGALGEAWAGFRFLLALRSFLRHPVSPDQAVAEIANRIEQRTSNLLKLVQQAVYENPASPYRWLLGQAGCEFGDFEQLVQREGAEGALQELFRHGVYLTVDEFKGKKTVARGSSTLWINPLALRNHRSTVYSAMQSSGTSGTPSAPIPLTLGYVRTRAANTSLMLQARQGREWLHAMWGVPGGAGEALTPARRAVIEAAGARVGVSYGIAECGWIGQGCLEPETSDDLHLYEDVHAVIQPGVDGARQSLPPGALLISSLSSTAGVVLLNVSFGDQAEMVERQCGCPMEQFGWRRHLQNVRSYEKLTAGGMTFLDTDIIRVLEETLPKKFRWWSDRLSARGRRSGGRAASTPSAGQSRAWPVEHRSYSGEFLRGHRRRIGSREDHGVAMARRSSASRRARHSAQHDQGKNTSSLP